MVMKLHHFAHSSASYRVRIALALKGIDVDYVNVDMPNLEQQGEAYANINPQRLVPCLELEDGTVLGQSLAIIDYLERRFTTSRLYPENDLKRAEAQSLALYIACETSPIQAKIVQRYLQSKFDLSNENIQNWLNHWIRNGLGTLDKYLKERPVKSIFAMGDTPGIVDLIAIPQIRNASRFNVDISDFFALNSLNNACLEHPAFQAAHPDKWTF